MFYLKPTSQNILINRWQNDNINKENDVVYICTKLPLIRIYLAGLVHGDTKISAASYPHTHVYVLLQI